MVPFSFKLIRLLSAVFDFYSACRVSLFCRFTKLSCSVELLLLKQHCIFCRKKLPLDYPKGIYSLLLHTIRTADCCPLYTSPPPQACLNLMMSYMDAILLMTVDQKSYTGRLASIDFLFYIPDCFFRVNSVSRS